MVNDLTFDKLFNSYYIQTEVLIPYFTNSTQTPYSNKPFVNYLKYLMTEIVLGGLFTTHTAYELIWGYNDTFLNFMKNNNYYSGGDPTLDPNFNLLHNMTKKPDPEDVWEINTGAKNISDIRQYSAVYGYPEKKIV